jgi:hypothetical protein
MTDPDRQISFEARLLKIVDPTWRDSLLDRMRRVHQDAETAAWILDEPVLRDLLEFVQRDSHGDMVVMPKVTTFEGDRATFIDHKKLHYIAGVEKHQSAESSGFNPIPKEVDFGWQIDLSGEILPGLIRSTVDLRDTYVLAVHGRQTRGSFKVKANPSEVKTLTATYQVPVLSTKRFQGTNNIPEGSSLLISLGFQEERQELPAVMGGAIEIIRTVVGGPPVEARRIARERLVLITPRKIILESEEWRFKQQSSKAKAATKQPGTGQQATSFNASASVNY